MTVENLFLSILNSSLSAVWLVLAVVLVRLVFKKAPKWLSCLLWGVVALRLLCPISIESVFSLIPSSQPIPADTAFSATPVVDTGLPVVDAVVNPILSDSLAPAPGDSINPSQVLLFAAGVLWVTGMLVMGLYTLITTWRLRRQVRESIPLRDNIRLCDTLSTPFILGVFRPRIYLPSHLTEEQMAYVIAHEQAHLRRRDHLWKPLGYLLLTIHWFNPALWLAYILLCRDIELACDERVVRDMGNEERRVYSETLLACSAPRRLVTACPLAFGETGVKQRIKSVLHYKKPAFWLLIAAAVACVVVAVCFLTDPLTPKVDEELDALIVDTVKQHNSGREDAGQPFVAYTVFGIKEDKQYTNVYGMALYQEYHLEEGDSLRKVGGSHMAFALTAEKAGDTYVPIQYWTPEDGAYYEPSIRERFPWQYEAKALDTQRYIEAHQADCLAQARNYFGLAEKAAYITYICDVNGTRFYLDPIISGTCRFTTSPLSSYMAVGKYTMSDTSMTLDFTDFKLIFERQGEAYVFDAVASDPIPEDMQFGADFELPHGTVFFRDLSAELTQRQTLSRMNWVSDDLEQKLYAAVLRDGGSENIPAFCIRDRAEWESFMETYWGDALQEDTLWADEMQQKIGEYDDAFFADYALLVAYYRHGSYSVTPQLVGVEYAEEGPTLELMLDVYEPEAQDSAVGEWLLTAGIPRDAVGFIKEVRGYVREHIAESTANLQYIEQAEITDTPLLGSDWRLFTDERLTYRPETDDEQAPVLRMTSRAELDAFIAKYRDTLKLNLRQPYTHANFVETVAVYDEAFFENNSLLVIYVLAESGTTHHQVSAVAYSAADSTLTVQIDRYDQPPIGGEPTCHLFTVTVGKVFDDLAKTCLAQLTPLQEVDWSDDSTTPSVNENYVTHTTQVKAQHVFMGKVLEMSKDEKYLLVESAEPDKFSGKVLVRTDQYAGGLKMVGELVQVWYNEADLGADPPQVYALAIHYAEEQVSTTVSTTSTPFPGMSTKEEHPTTAPSRIPNAAGVVNIIDWTEIQNISVGQAFQTFYEDADYEYQFNTWKKDYVIVHYADGSEKTVDVALADGDITLADLDGYGIVYTKRPHETTTAPTTTLHREGTAEVFFFDAPLTYTEAWSSTLPMQPYALSDAQFQRLCQIVERAYWEPVERHMIGFDGYFTFSDGRTYYFGIQGDVLYDGTNLGYISDDEAAWLQALHDAML